MPNREKIRAALQKLVHPETGADIVNSGIVETIDTADGTISLVLSFPKSRDPFAGSIKRQAEAAIAEALPEYAGRISILVKEAAPKRREAPSARSSAGDIRKIIAVVSGKGGVGKSTVTSNLAVRLARDGCKVGVLDADIYGPSQPKMFGVEGYRPEAIGEDGAELIAPARKDGVSLMSVGFFISPDDALVWRGPMASSALKQMIHQTAWGELDFLLIDMPPGTGDVHLTIMQELPVDGAIVVSTPQQVAVADAVRAVRMLRSKDIGVPVLGVIENMAWFTPAELPDNRYYLFGRGGAAELAAKEGVELLGEIPVVQSVMEGGETGIPAAGSNPIISRYYEQVAKKVVEKLG